MRTTFDVTDSRSADRPGRDRRCEHRRGELTVRQPTLGQLREQVGAGLDAAVEVGERELLVGPVEVVVVLAPAEEQGIDAQVLLDQADDRDRAPLADEDRLGAEPGLDGPDRGADARACRRRPGPPAPRGGSMIS